MPDFLIVASLAPLYRFNPRNLPATERLSTSSESLVVGIVEVEVKPDAGLGRGRGVAGVRETYPTKRIRRCKNRGVRPSGDCGPESISDGSVPASRRAGTSRVRPAGAPSGDHRAILDVGVLARQSGSRGPVLAWGGVEVDRAGERRGGDRRDWWAVCVGYRAPTAGTDACGGDALLSRWDDPRGTGRQGREPLHRLARNAGSRIDRYGRASELVSARALA